MIPKVIHYCWFGHNPLPKMAEKCIKSWEKYCPGYEIVEWNESNFDVDCCDYIREAYQAGKWAFVSDYARFKILYERGGLYFDTDVELIKPIDDIIARGPFMGLEAYDAPIAAPGLGLAANPGLGLAANPGLGLYREILDDYEKSHFITEGPCVTVVERVTAILSRHGAISVDGISSVAGITIYPSEYFCPLSYFSGEMNVTENTRSIHHYMASWISGLGRVIHEIDVWRTGRGRAASIVAETVMLLLKVINKIWTEGLTGTIRFVRRSILNREL